MLSFEIIVPSALLRNLFVSRDFSVVVKDLSMTVFGRARPILSLLSIPCVNKSVALAITCSKVLVLILTRAHSLGVVIVSHIFERCPIVSMTAIVLSFLLFALGLKVGLLILMIKVNSLMHRHIFSLNRKIYALRRRLRSRAHR